MKIYIVKGLNTDNDNCYAVVSEFGVRETLESAKQELKEVIDEIKKECGKCNTEIVNEKIFEDRFVIETEFGALYDYEIIENRIKELEKQLDYFDKRDKVCCSMDGEQERYEVETELEQLEEKIY